MELSLPLQEVKCIKCPANVCLQLSFKRSLRSLEITAAKKLFSLGILTSCRWLKKKSTPIKTLLKDDKGDDNNQGQDSGNSWPVKYY